MVRKKQIRNVIYCATLVMMLSGIAFLYGQKMKDCVGSGKSVCEKTCEYYEGGSVKKISCRVDFYGINNTLECRCCHR